MKNQFIESKDLIDSLNDMILELKSMRSSNFVSVNSAFYAYLDIAVFVLNFAKAHVCEVG